MWKFLWRVEAFPRTFPRLPTQVAPATKGQPMRVICAGFGRTGTASLKSALETLLEGRCYHFEELFKHGEQRTAWAQFVRG